MTYSKITDRHNDTGFLQAFDTVPHNSLLNKMKCYGVDGNINNWLRDFLTNWTMQVVVNGESAEAASVDSVFSQGTVLGPLLFLCHINDLPDQVESTVRLFADDCLLYRCIRSVRDHTLLQKDLHELNWEVGHNMGYAVQRQHVLCYEHKPEIKSLLSTRQSNPQTSRRNSIPRCNSFRRSQI